MNVRFLETFIWVARLRSFSAAAVRLNSTQAAVSNRIATLERDLGTRLFERDLRDVRLTGPGRLLLERAADIVRLTNEFRETVGNAQMARTTVSIGAVDMIAHAWLPLLLNRLKSEHQGFGLSLSVDTSLNLARQLTLGEIDLGLLMGPILDANLVNIDLGEFECCWIAAPDCPLPDAPLEFKDLTVLPFITYSKDSLPHHALLQALDARGIDRNTVSIFNSNAAATIIRLVRDGVGTASIPRLVANEFIERGEMRVLDVDAVMPPLRFHAAYSSRRGSQAPAVVAELAASVAQAFCACPSSWLNPEASRSAQSVRLRSANG